VTDSKIHVADNTPVLVGAGQFCPATTDDQSPMRLAGQAAQRAVDDCGAPEISSAIDTVAVVRLFTDSPGSWNSEHARSNNPPESVARAIGASPKHRIYTPIGGNVPMSLVIEFARDIALGERDTVLIAGGEALRNQKEIMRAGEEPDWEETFDTPLEERPAIDSRLLSRQEFFTGPPLPMHLYTLIEQARRHKLGVSREDYERDMANLLLHFNSVAQENEYAQFADEHSEESLLGAKTLTQTYTSRMVAQDNVNQAAALLLTSAGRARELGIPEERWVFLHGAAEGEDLLMSEREDLSASPMAGLVVQQSLAMAGIDAADIGYWDIYSCFPCAVTAITDAMELPVDGSVPLTLTGGLPYFGGPGNNYAMHGLAEAVWQCRRAPEAYTAVTANGGFLSKHATGIFSCRPSALDFQTLEFKVGNTQLPRKTIAENPDAGRICTYAVAYRKGEPAKVFVLGETDTGERFACANAPDDTRTVKAIAASDDAIGMAVQVSRGENEHQLIFTLAD
jgi:acetyl-CoA C-acetyltransferase